MTSAWTAFTTIRARKTGLWRLLLAASVVTAGAAAQQVRLAPTVTTLVGTQTSGAQRLVSVSGLAVDGEGKQLYIADETQNVVFRLDLATRSLTIFAGTPFHAGNSGDGGAAASALIAGPRALAVTGDGSLLMADSGNHAVRKVTAEGIISTAASADAALALVDPASGRAQAFSANSVSGVAALSADQSNTLAVLKAERGALAGSTVQSVTAGRDGTLYAGVMDASGAMAVVELQNAYRILIPPISQPVQGAAATMIALQILSDVSGGLYAGTEATQAAVEFTVGQSTDCTTDGSVVLYAGTVCHFPLYFTPAAPGRRMARLLVETNSETVFGMEGSGYISQATLMPGTISKSVFLSQGTYVPGQGYVPPSPFVFNTPVGLVFDQRGNGFIADLAANRVYAFMASFGGPTLSNFAGNGTAGFSGDGSYAFNAMLNGPAAIARDSAGIVYIADAGNHRVRAVNTSNGVITTVAGDGGTTNANDGQQGTSASLDNPVALTVDLDGSLLIADAGMHRVRRLNVDTGIITTIAGTGVAGTSGDGGLATAATLSVPSGVAVGVGGDIYISDAAANTVRRISPTNGHISVFAGTGTSGASGDFGSPTNATLNSPQALLTDAVGGLYIADTGNNLVRYVTHPAAGQAATILTVAGNVNLNTVVNNVSAVASKVAGPEGMALDSSNDLLVAEYTGHDFRTLSGNTASLAFPDTAVPNASSTQSTQVVETGLLDPANAIAFKPVTSLNSVANFVVATPSGNCDGLGATGLGNGQRCSVDLTFAPESAGVKSGTVAVAEQRATDTLMQYISAAGTGTGVQAFTFSPGTVPSAVVNVAYSQQIKATGGTGDLTLTEQGSLPSGITFSSTNGLAMLAGTTTASGSYPFTVTVTDANAATLTQNYTLVVSAGAVSITVTETVHVTDAVLVSPSVMIGVTETVHVTDSPVVMPAAQIVVTETVHVNDAPSVVRTNVAQTITFTIPAGPFIYGDTVPLTVSSDSGLPVTVSILTGSGTISNNVLTIRGTSPITLAANQAGDGTYAPAATVTQSLQAGRAPLVVHVASVTRPYGKKNPKFTATYTGLKNGDMFVGISLISTGKTKSPAGQYPITSKFPNNGLYDFTVEPGTLTILGGASQKIKFSLKKKVRYSQLKNHLVKLNAKSSSGLYIYYTVSGPGFVEGKTLMVTGTGDITVTATQPGNDTFAAAADVTHILTVTP